ncbi:hypothetical protein LRAMOSA06041 [Lichtheimia ramosa]|uniref:Ion transport domain-containing protein n=1 Tax=Lichtheimia ramosa TaxID=688394 RepID=A0A077X4C4_9FUNG|nr:hypothetical protein LRAMOSA06041 [Lichtheimia ramosa]
MTLTRTPYWLTRSEMVQSMANRIMYSRFYIGLYIGLAALSVLSIVMSLRETCPSPLFLLFEFVINMAMMMEVTIRFLALRKAFWHSLWNVMDAMLVLLCVVTLLVLMFADCSAGERREAMIDTILLVVRNGVQLYRLITVARKNKRSIAVRSSTIDFRYVDEEDIDLYKMEEQEEQFWHEYGNDHL